MISWTAVLPGRLGNIPLFGRGNTGLVETRMAHQRLLAGVGAEII